MKKKHHIKKTNTKKNIFLNSFDFNNYFYYFLLVLFAIFILILIKTAWLCDDAFITFRVIDNFVNGYGLRFNVVERVQAYTHPLWLFFITIPYFFLRDPFYTPIILSILLTLLTSIIIIFKISGSKFNSYLVLLLLISSKAFIDYSTSGLENVLSHLIGIIFIYFYLKEIGEKNKILILSFLISLAFLNRMDTILIYLPPLIFLIYKSKNIKSILYILLGFLPIVLWIGFSIIYYGFPLPNTYYAKLNTGIPKIDLFKQGLYYFVNSLKFDSITLILIIIVLTLSFFYRKKIFYPIIFGLLLYLLYIIYIGGDFMSGRFFTLPFIISIAILSNFLIIKSTQNKILSVLVLILYIILYQNSPIKSGINYTDKSFNFLEEKGISDERGFYYQNASLWKAINGQKMPDHKMQATAKFLNKNNEKVFLAGAIGFIGYYAGPSIYVMDVYALSDALLSKLPVVKYDIIYGAAYEKRFKRKPDKNWRIGHFLRPIPKGYTLSLLKNECLIEDEKLNEFYKKIKFITQSHIFSSERFSEILKINLGYYDYLINHFHSQDYNELNFMDELILNDPKNYLYYYKRGTYFYRRAKYKEAIPDFEKCLILNNNYAQCWYNLSVSQYFLKEYEKALISCKNARILGEKVDPEFEKELVRIVEQNRKNIK